MPRFNLWMCVDAGNEISGIAVLEMALPAAVVSDALKIIDVDVDSKGWDIFATGEEISNLLAQGAAITEEKKRYNSRMLPFDLMLSDLKRSARSGGEAVARAIIAKAMLVR